MRWALVWENMVCQILTPGGSGMRNRTLRHNEEIHQVFFRYRYNKRVGNLNQEKWQQTNEEKHTRLDSEVHVQIYQDWPAEGKKQGSRTSTGSNREPFWVGTNSGWRSDWGGVGYHWKLRRKPSKIFDHEICLEGKKTSTLLGERPSEKEWGEGRKTNWVG